MSLEISIQTKAIPDALVVNATQLPWTDNIGQRIMAIVKYLRIFDGGGSYLVLVGDNIIDKQDKAEKSDVRLIFNLNKIDQMELFKSYL